MPSINLLYRNMVAAILSCIIETSVDTVPTKYCILMFMLLIYENINMIFTGREERQPEKGQQNTLPSGRCVQTKVNINIPSLFNLAPICNKNDFKLGKNSSLLYPNGRYFEMSLREKRNQYNMFLKYQDCVFCQSE